MAKRTYTVEITYMLPVYKHVQVDASSAIQACELALQDENWDNGKECWDGSREDHVTGIWAGSDAYHGRSFNVPLKFQDKPENALRLISELARSDLSQSKFLERCKIIAELI